MIHMAREGLSLTRNADGLAVSMYVCNLFTHGGPRNYNNSFRNICAFQDRKGIWKCWWSGHSIMWYSFRVEVACFDFCFNKL